MKIHFKTSKKLLILIAVIVLATAGAGAVYAYLRHSAKPAGQTTATNNYGSVPTYPAQSEGKSIQVPTNVDPSEIKNYKLIVDNEEFKIRYLDGTYTITLYAIINRPDQASMYKDQLRQYKQDALKYLSDHGVDPTKVKIVYEPQEAANL